VRRVKSLPLLILAAASCAGPQRPAATVPDLQPFELARRPAAEVRALLKSTDGAVRARAALAAGRIADSEALASLEALLLAPEAGEAAAWALGRIDGGQPALSKCLETNCPAMHAAARASTDVEALLRALHGPAGEEAGFALGVLARGKTQFPESIAAQLAQASARPEAEKGALYALSRIPKSAAPDVQPALVAALKSPDVWTRSLAARAWGRHGLPAAELPFHDAEWRVRVEAARALATAAGAKLEFHGTEALGLDLMQESPHVVISLFETAATLNVLAPEPASFKHPAVRCAAAQSRDRVRKRLIDTPGCESGWPGRAKAGALAAELGLRAEARKAFADEDGRVRAAAAGAAASKDFAEDLRKLLQDPDPFVVSNAAGSLAKDKDPAASREAALAAVQRLSAAHLKGAGDPESDALTALVPLTGPVPSLLPTPNPALAAALGVHGVAAQLPPEADKKVRVLRIKTSKGELIADLRTDIAPITSAALAALATRHFYDGLDFHRVVPDFVVQGGDPRGDGDGGPGWAVPDEHSPLRFERGTLGIATNGPETGGSQFFFCHSPQPHLEGRYTVAGQLRPDSLKVLDDLQIGDKIISAGAE
jgi:cyclophilin family peptidyl-prolyl cis-trans isomerase/HEAT repeat protein